MIERLNAYVSRRATVSEIQMIMNGVMESEKLMVAHHHACDGGGHDHDHEKHQHEKHGGGGKHDHGHSHGHGEKNAAKSQQLDGGHSHSHSHVDRDFLSLKPFSEGSLKEPGIAKVTENPYEVSSYDDGRGGVNTK